MNLAIFAPAKPLQKSYLRRRRKISCRSLQLRSFKVLIDIFNLSRQQVAIELLGLFTFGQKGLVILLFELMVEIGVQFILGELG